MEDLFDRHNRRRVILRDDRKRSVANQHPWIFSGAILLEEGPDDAALADVYDTAGRRLASGFYSRHSQIRVRAVAFGEEELTPDLIRARLAAAVRARDEILDAGTTAARLVHSEGDRISGLIVDRYRDVLVVEISSSGLDRIRNLIFRFLEEIVPARSIRVKNDLPARRLERLDQTDFWIGDPIEEVEIRESALRFVVAMRDSQKTGFFLDQRENRGLARALGRGRRVLNAFGYTGAFGVSAAAGGAVSVEEVDVSAGAIGLARRNHLLNESPAAKSFVVSDAFDLLRERVRDGAVYDLVICDPPAFARSRNDVERAARGYKDINLHAMRLLAPGGLLMTFSCSGHVDPDLFQKIVFGAALDARRNAAIVRRLGAGADHPVSIYCPEGDYLKGLLLRMDR